MDDRNNSGNDNSGDWNSGDWNSGYYNSGYYNSGNWNSGNRNSGHCNSGHWNSGNDNSGDWNSGDWNSGDWNSGYYNSGNWNSGNRNSGHFNSKRPDTIRVFNKDLSYKIWESRVIPSWLYFNLNMATYKESAKAAWDKASHKDRMLTYKLPNFDADVAQDIFGIDFKQYLIDNDDNKDEFITINGQKYKRVI
jgi:hypothetical protein